MNLAFHPSSIFLMPPNSNMFSIGGECVMCHGSKVPRATQNLLTSWGNNNLNFQLTCDQVVYLETAVNLCISRCQENINFFAVMAAKHFFELGGITKHLLTGPTVNSEFCFSSTLNVPLGFTSGPVIKCLLFLKLTQELDKKKLTSNFSWHFNIDMIKKSGFEHNFHSGS